MIFPVDRGNITDVDAFKEKVYNTWLKATALANHRPYRVRKDFSAIKADDSAALDRLHRIFSGFPGVNILEYFLASYAARENDFAGGNAFIPLSDFAKPAAMRRYLDSYKNVSGLSDKNILGRTVRGFSNIVEKCKANGWRIAQYIGDPGLGSVGFYEWATDFVNHDITEYNIIAFDLIGFNTESAVRKTMTDEDIECYFNGRYSDVVTSKIDGLSKEETDMLIELLRRSKKAVDTAFQK